MDLTQPAPTRRHFIFISGNKTWGGSEELWSATAARLAEDGHAVTVFKSRIDEAEPRIRRLRELACTIRDLSRFPFMPRHVFSALAILSHPLMFAHDNARLRLGLTASARPDLVVISQGGNYDGLLIADICRRMKLPYVLIAQKATEMYWVPDRRLERLREAYRCARACYFVSDANRRLTEEQLGLRLPYATVVRNPFLVSWHAPEEWPQDDDGLRLACVARLYPAEKGQDLILRVLARDTWRARAISVTFFGDGPHREGLTRMAALLGLTSVRFGGFISDVASIWADHHALVLPSRCEGLPLALIEAMLSGRFAVVTDVGGNREVIEDGATGFLASAPTEDALDAALERAWSRRSEWRAIGATASSAIRALVPRDPVGVMAATLLQQIEQDLGPAEALDALEAG
jgi:glycosyltransferase involved in cell wall biosynthesis